MGDYTLSGLGPRSMSASLLSASLLSAVRGRSSSKDSSSILIGGRSASGETGTERKSSVAFSTGGGTTSKHSVEECETGGPLMLYPSDRTETNDSVGGEAAVVKDSREQTKDSRGGGPVGILSSPPSAPLPDFFEQGGKAARRSADHLTASSRRSVAIDPVAEGPQFAKQHLTRVLSTRALQNPDDLVIAGKSRRAVGERGAAFAPSSGGAPALSFQQLKKLLLKRGSYPDEERAMIWMFLLQLPGNQTAYEALLQPQTPLDADLARLTKAFPSNQHSRKTLVRLRALLTSLSAWAGPPLATTGFLPRLVFPFAKLFGANGCVAFEVTASVLLLYCRSWFSGRRDGEVEVVPETVERNLDLFLQEHEPELHAHLKRAMLEQDGAAPEDPTATTISVSAFYLWPILKTLATSLLERGCWLYLFDHLLTHWNKPLLLHAFCVSLLRYLKISLLRSNNPKKLLQQEQLINARAVVADMYRIHRFVEAFYADLGPRSCAADAGGLGPHDNAQEDRETASKPPVPLPKGFCYPAFCVRTVESSSARPLEDQSSVLPEGDEEDEDPQTVLEHVRAEQGDINISPALLSRTHDLHGYSVVSAPMSPVSRGDGDWRPREEADVLVTRRSVDGPPKFDFAAERWRLERLIQERETELVHLQGEILATVS